MPQALPWKIRARFAAQYAARHGLVSVAVAALAALLVFAGWYPAPTAQLLQVGSVYAVVLAVDVVCGPLLTLVLASPHKPRRELWTDLAIVGAIQLAALGYGLHALASARPVAYVFEQDRIVLVAKNEIYTAPDCEASQTCGPALPMWGQHWFHAQSQLDSDRMRSLDLSLQGVSMAQRPELWAAWDWQHPQVQAALRPLSALSAASGAQLQAQQGDAYLARNDLRYLPLVSSKTLDWIAVFDLQGQWLDSFAVDGF